MTSHDFPYGPRRYNVYCSSTFKWKEETYYCKNILDGVNVYAIDAIYAKNEESLVKTAFPLGNENTAWCLWATVEEQVQGFFWGLRAPRGQEPLSQSTPPPHFRHSSLILKTMMVMSTAKRIVVRSVTVIYTEMFARTWCNTDLLVWRADFLNFLKKKFYLEICRKSRQHWSDVSLIEQRKAWSSSWDIPLRFYECKAPLNVSGTPSNSRWERCSTKDVTMAEVPHFNGGRRWDASAAAFVLLSQRTGVKNTGLIFVLGLIRWVIIKNEQRWSLAPLGVLEKGKLWWKRV